MGILLKLLELVVGAASIIAWVSILGVLYTKMAPVKLLKKKITLVECIAMAGIGLFCTLFTLFFLFVAAKVGLAKLEINQVFGTLLSGSEGGGIYKWLARMVTVSFGVMGSFLYARFIFVRFPDLRPFLKGFMLSGGLFLIACAVVFPIVSAFPAVQMADLNVPAFFGPLSGQVRVLVTFLLATIFFGNLMANIYNQWEEA